MSLGPREAVGRAFALGHRPALDLTAAENESGDAQLEWLARIPRVFGGTPQFQPAGDGGTLTAPETNLDPLTNRQSPSCADLVAQFGCRRRRGAERGVEGKTDLVFGHARKCLKSAAVGQAR